MVDIMHICRFRERKGGLQRRRMCVSWLQMVKKWKTNGSWINTSRLIQELLRLLTLIGGFQVGFTFFPCHADLVVSVPNGVLNCGHLQTAVCLCWCICCWKIHTRRGETGFLHLFYMKINLATWHLDEGNVLTVFNLLDLSCCTWLLPKLPCFPQSEDACGARNCKC